MLRTMYREPKPYHKHQDRPVWLYSETQGPLSLNCDLTIAEAETLQSSLAASIEEAKEAAAIKEQSEAEAAEFAAFKAARDQQKEAA